MDGNITNEVPFALYDTYLLHKSNKIGNINYGKNNFT